MTSVEDLQNDIKYINEIIALYVNKTNSVDENTLKAIKVIDDALVIERKNEEFLQNVENMILDDKIENKKGALNNCLKSIEDKKQEYLSLIKKNTNKIIELSSQIRIKKDSIDNVISLCDTLDNNIAILGNKPISNP